MLMYTMAMFFCGLWVFSSNRKHLLAMLLSLEFIVLAMYMALCLYLLMTGFEMFFGMVFLTFSVCEGSLGLSILVSMIRGYGSDFFNIYNILQC